MNDEDFQLSEEIRRYIASLNSASQEPYVSERSIAERFGLNRSTARRLLLQFEGEGILECLPKRGYRRVDYSKTTLRTYYIIRSAIECEALRLAQERATREDILRLMLILEDADKVLAEKRYSDFPPLDSAFHHALVSAAHDVFLQKMYNLIVIQTTPAVLPPPELAVGAQRTHRQVFEALRAGHADKAAKILHDKHFGNATDAIDAEAFLHFSMRSMKSSPQKKKKNPPAN